MNDSILHLPVLPVRPFNGETDALTAHRQRLSLESAEEAAESPTRMNYAHACAYPRAAMAEGD